MIKKERKEVTSWVQDFAEFLAVEPISPSPTLSKKILERVSSSLNPSPWIVFARFSTIVFAVGLVNLLICPQFGLSYFRNPGLVHFFMAFGPIGCHAACGMFFIGSGVLVSAIVLRPEELKVMRRTKFLQLASVSALVLAAFVALGAEVFVPLSLAWFLGAVAGGILSLEITFRIRRFSLRFI